MGKILGLFSLIIISIGLILVITLSLSQGKDKKGEIMENVSENINKNKIKETNITVTFDNNQYKDGLKTSWGFSCLIRGAEKTILFDTGGDDSILLENMKKLEIDSEEIDLIVLSHIHGDHIGGLYGFLEKNPKVYVYLPKSFPTSLKKNIEKYGAKVVDVQKPVEICKGIYSTGELGTLIIEQSLIIYTDKGMLVITGCAHPGIVKIVERAKKIIKDKVLLVMGGFHLRNKSSKQIEKIISSLKNMEVKYAGPCHCSGDNARKLFEKEYQKNYINIGVGKVINTKDL
jgi:7,8-dihydropterin-6-yl-methyl-4-(beta-D-ribofuranosyl)aminobenzene 5'-phosphate synthase